MEVIQEEEVVSDDNEPMLLGTITTIKEATSWYANMVCSLKEDAFCSLRTFGKKWF